MAYLNTYVLDNGLLVLSNDTEELHICTSEPASYVAAMLTSLGQKVGPVVNTPSEEPGYLREVIVGAVADGVVDTGGTANAWALVDVTNTRLLAAGPLAAPVVVTAGHGFTLTTFSILIGLYA